MITVVGSINQDIFLYPNSLPRVGETVISNSVEYRLGGKGINSAIASTYASKSQVCFVGCIGDDDASVFIQSELKKYPSLKTDLKIVQSCPSGRAFINVDMKGENSIVIVPGANFHGFDSKDVMQIDEACKYLVTNFEIPESFILALFEKYSDQNIRKVLNFSPIPKDFNIFSKILKLADYLVLNEVEAEYLGDLISLVENVVITMGSKGAVWYKSGVEMCSCSAPKIDPVSTVGAGDCFLGTFVASLANGLDEKAAIYRAVNAAADSCMRSGAADSYQQLMD